MKITEKKVIRVVKIYTCELCGTDHKTKAKAKECQEKCNMSTLIDLVTDTRRKVKTCSRCKYSRYYGEDEWNCQVIDTVNPQHMTCDAWKRNE